ncbi:MAG: biotin-dependent carboxyltransferase family protein [Mycobacterium sp.]
MALLVEEPGLASSIQDLGRPGHYNVGIPLGGAMDTLAHEIANLLVGNERGAATVECTYTGPHLTVTAPTTMAVTGAVMDVRVNGEMVPQWTAVALDEGDSVVLGFASAGARAYLAFAGGIDVPVVLGSRGTYGLGKIGGLQGRPLTGGDELTLGQASSRPGVGRGLSEASRPQYARNTESRIIWGPYDHRLIEESRELLTASEWTLTPVADRTGLRFNGDQKFEFVPREQPFGAGSDPSNIVDAGYAMGSIQIPGGSQPIVLHRDAVSAGGYAMVATVISPDLNALAQLTPGSTTRFEAVTIEEALQARKDAQAKRGRILAELAS